jgi:hypothetical protein
MIDVDECEAVSGMRIGRRKRSTRGNSTPVSLLPPQIPHDLIWARTRSTALGNRRLTARAMAWLLAFTLVVHFLGRSIEAVSRWISTAAARVRARVWRVEFVVDKVASGQGFSEYFGFPCQNRSFHQHYPGRWPRPCDELITHPRSTADCPRSSN